MLFTQLCPELVLSCEHEQYLGVYKTFSSGIMDMWHMIIIIITIIIPMELQLISL